MIRIYHGLDPSPASGTCSLHDVSKKSLKQLFNPTYQLEIGVIGIAVGIFLIAPAHNNPWEYNQELVKL